MYSSMRLGQALPWGSLKSVVPLARSLGSAINQELWLGSKPVKRSKGTARTLQSSETVWAGGLGQWDFRSQTPKGWKGIKSRLHMKGLAWEKGKIHGASGKGAMSWSVLGSRAGQSSTRLVLAPKENMIRNQMNNGVSKHHWGCSWD